MDIVNVLVGLSGIWDEFERDDERTLSTLELAVIARRPDALEIVQTTPRRRWQTLLTRIRRQR
ncbi:MAG: hypothetical protein H6738_18135 [Alphaproteobacteria bacterium]|nr:hypothetical protein [Alphaproteobacteria bacterium]